MYTKTHVVNNVIVVFDLDETHELQFMKYMNLFIYGNPRHIKMVSILEHCYLCNNVIYLFIKNVNNHQYLKYLEALNDLIA